MRSLAFYAVFGLMPGYFDPTKPIYEPGDLHPSIRIAEIWQRHMQAEFDNTNILVSAVFTDSRTVYPLSMGCPPGGEVTVTANGHINPKPIKGLDFSTFTCELKNWRSAVLRVCKAVKEELKQTTVSVAFYNIENFVYFKSESENAT